MRRDRGFVLLTVLVLSVLYFGFMTLLLIDAAEASRSAHRYRSRVVADVLAENGYELAARAISVQWSATVNGDVDGGRVEARMTRRSTGEFEVESAARSAGVYPVHSSVRVEGRAGESGVVILRIVHSGGEKAKSE